MVKSLVIVESPAKAKTIGKFLGKNYKIKASVGHVIDLPKSKLGVDIENNFEPKYITIRGKGQILNEIKKEAKKVDKIFLATDPDREGEAISWHLANALNLDCNEKIRIEFNEITKNAVKNAIKNPRKIKMDLVNAQQARRVLDRLVGYKISPLLWKKVRKGLSAGRVQSVATKIICDRENEINNFVPEEYWTIEVNLGHNSKIINAEFLGTMENNKEKKIKLKTEKDVNYIADVLKNDEYIIYDIKKRIKKRNPYPPYTTSSLQQDAANRLGFSTKKTMQIAQQLYEGVELKKIGTVGLVTYIRTDSTRISNEAKNACNNYIEKSFGSSYLGSGTKNKKKDIQDAHEAIRPTSVSLIPDEIKEYLSKDQYKLYDLIWRRFVASQMSQAIFETLTIKIKCKEYILKTSGSKMKFDGFLKIYDTKTENKTHNIPELNIGEKLKLIEIKPKQHFTQPPPRFTEASLVKQLEELGIGRPATYSPTISTILSRGYVTIEKKQLKPTELGFIVTEILTEYFKDIVNEKFTAEMEKKLDYIEEGKLEWKKIINEFYDNFKKELEVAEKEIEKIEIKDEVSDVICEKCGNNMVIKQGRFGKFLACPGYPDCKNTKPLVKNLGIKCPECDGEIVERRSKKGKKFYGCTNFPECNFVTWDEPSDEKCPECNNNFVIKRNKARNYLYCQNCKTKKEIKRSEE